MSEKHKSNSFLKQAPTRSGGLFLDINKLPKIPAKLGDEPYVINHRYDERPDLLAADLYGDSNLWWVFAIRNPDQILDPIRDFKTGVTIMIPAATTINNL